MFAVAKPMPPILLSREEADTGIRREIRATKGVWTVLYDGQTFQEVRLWPLGCTKYDRAIFGTPGAALLVARKLNAAYETDRFTVHQMMVCSSALPDPRAGK